MPKRSSTPEDPDHQQMARSVLDAVAPDAVGAAAGERESEQEPPADEGKNPAAVALGRLGGLKGGKARAEKLTPERRSEIAKKAAATRWKNQSKDI